VELFNIGDAIGVTSGPKFNVIRSTVDPGRFESGTSGGEPVLVISVTARGSDGKRAVDDGTGKPGGAGAGNGEKVGIDESGKDKPLAKVEPNTRPFSAAKGDGTPGLAVAQYDEAGKFITQVTLADGRKVDFTGKGMTDDDIEKFLKDPSKGNLVGNDGIVKRAQDGSGGDVTCQG